MSSLAPRDGHAPAPTPQTQTPDGASNLADVLERVLDKGVVIAGDIQINLLDIELLTIKLRLVIASVDTAKRMGICWWESDPMLSGKADDGGEDRRALSRRIAELERRLEQATA